MPHEHRRASIDSKAFSLYHDDHDDDNMMMIMMTRMMSKLIMTNVSFLVLDIKKWGSQLKNLSRKSRDVSAENKIGAKS